MLDKIKADIEKAKARVNVIPLEAGNARAMMNQLVPPFGDPKETSTHCEFCHRLLGDGWFHRGQLNAAGAELLECRPAKKATKKDREQDRFKTAADLGYVWEGKEQALREIKEAQEAYNVEMLERYKRLQPKLDALPNDATVEQISTVLNEGKKELPW